MEIAHGFHIHAHGAGEISERNLFDMNDSDGRRIGAGLDRAIARSRPAPIRRPSLSFMSKRFR
ncbi:MAG TPA: hypothetical protein PLV61_04685, partial [Parvularculaceae bacterium]|nr:hypothetical protein [Parvularculaceae bacterium]